MLFRSMKALGVENLNLADRARIAQLEANQQTIEFGKNHQSIGILLQDYYKFTNTMVPVIDGVANTKEGLYGASSAADILRLAVNKLKGEFTSIPWEALVSQGYQTVQMFDENQKSANELFLQLKAGTISVREYQVAISQLQGIELPKTFEEVQFAVGKSVRSFDNARALAAKLREEVAAGRISWKEYSAAVQEIGQEHFPEYERQLSQLTPMTELLARTVEESATRMSQSFTDSFYTILKEGKFTFSSFRDFVGGILDDIAKQVIKKSFSDPIASGIAGVINGDRKSTRLNSSHT